MTDALLTPAEYAHRAGIVVRGGKVEDLESWNEMFSEPSVTRGTMQVPYVTLERRRARWLDLLLDANAAVMMATDPETDLVVGSLTLHLQTRTRRRHTAAFGMGVREAWQGRGVGTALLAAACEHADQWWNVHRLELEVYADNEAAVGLYRKFGFEIEGTHRDYAFREGAYVDAYSMARVGRPARSER